MSTTRTRRRVTSLVGAIMLLLPVSLAMAQGPDLAMARPPRPESARRSDLHEVGNHVEFLSWRATGATDLANKFVGEIFQRQVSQRQADNCFLPAPNCGRIIRLEAFYEVQDKRGPFVHRADPGRDKRRHGCGRAGRHRPVRVARRSPRARGIQTIPGDDRAAWAHRRARTCFQGRSTSGPPHGTERAAARRRMRHSAAGLLRWQPSSSARIMDYATRELRAGYGSCRTMRMCGPLPPSGPCECPSMQRYPKKIALQVGLGKNECRRVGPGQQRTVLDHSCAWKFGYRGRHVDSGNW